MSKLNRLEQGCLRLHNEYTFGPRELAHVFGMSETRVLRLLAAAKAKAWLQDALCEPTSKVRLVG